MNFGLKTNESVQMSEMVGFDLEAKTNEKQEMRIRLGSETNGNYKNNNLLGVLFF